MGATIDGQVGKSQSKFIARKDKMSEERPSFKVTDRRLFNADGTPREIEREETFTPALETETASGPTTAASATQSTASSGAPQQASSREDINVAASSAGGEVAEDDLGEMGDEMGAESNDFVNLVMFIASPAAAALGMTDHPGMAGRGIDLPLAKHCIDLLGTLRERTSNSLSPQERQFFDGLLTELRMQFVSLSNARPSTGPRGGFTGSDITGGR